MVRAVSLPVGALSSFHNRVFHIDQKGVEHLIKSGIPKADLLSLGEVAATRGYSNPAPRPWPAPDSDSGIIAITVAVFSPSLLHFYHHSYYHRRCIFTVVFIFAVAVISSANMPRTLRYTSSESPPRNEIPKRHRRSLVIAHGPRKEELVVGILEVEVEPSGI